MPKHQPRKETRTIRSHKISIDSALVEVPYPQNKAKLAQDYKPSWG